ncbi:hypothetical protein EMMF5_001811 [Cystobasidiomycetes sp. EMM_F5]
MKTFTAQITVTAITLLSTVQAVVINLGAMSAGSPHLAPYYLRILPGGQAQAAALVTLPTQNSGSQYTWTVNVPAGTNVTVSITDGTGAVNYAYPTVVQAGSSNSCLSSSAIVSQSSTSSGVTSRQSSSSTAGPVTTSAPQPQSVTSSTTMSAPTTSRSNGAGTLAANTIAIAILAAGLVATIA